MITDISEEIVAQYIEKEQHNTVFDLDKKFNSLMSQLLVNIVVEIDCSIFNSNDFNYIQNLSALVTQTNQVGKFEIGNLKIHINNLNSFEDKLIKTDSEYFKNKLK